MGEMTQVANAILDKAKSLKVEDITGDGLTLKDMAKKAVEHIPEAAEGVVLVKMGGGCDYLISYVNDECVPIEGAPAFAFHTKSEDPAITSGLSGEEMMTLDTMSILG